MKQKEYDILILEGRFKESDMRKVKKRYRLIKYKKIINNLVSINCRKAKR